jgi:hypothetical protein
MALLQESLAVFESLVVKANAEVEVIRAVWVRASPALGVDLLGWFIAGITCLDDSSDSGVLLGSWLALETPPWSNVQIDLLEANHPAHLIVSVIPHISDVEHVHDVVVVVQLDWKIGVSLA